jgi:hypothetical protein
MKTEINQYNLFEDTTASTDLAQATTSPETLAVQPKDIQID